MTSRSLPEDLAVIEIGNIGSSDFYVPSLNYRIKGVDQYATNGKDTFEAHVYCEEFEKDLRWEWWRPNDEYDSEEGQRRSLRQKGLFYERESSIATVRTTKRRLLIGISSGYDNRAKLMERAVWSARVYGALWSGETSSSMDVTVVSLQGTAFSPHGCKAPSSHSSIDKIRLLFQAIDSESHYDRLLLLDADTMIYGMDTDLSSLEDGDDGFVVMGAPIFSDTSQGQKNEPWEIDSGMTYWNLEHPLTRAIALDWFKYAKNAIIRGSYRSDQKYLHKTLQQYSSTNGDDIGIVHSFENNKFDDYSRGTVVKKFGVQSDVKLQDQDPSIGSKVVEDRNDQQIKAQLDRMQEIARQICDRYSDACKNAGSKPRYETS